MKQTLLFILVILFISCSNKQNTDKNNSIISSKEEAEVEPKNEYPQLLGDKLLFYDSLDYNGLTSPDTVLILEKSTDSLSLLELSNKYSDKYKTGILNLSNYRNFEKQDTFAFFIDIQSNENILEEIGFGKKTILTKIRKENFDLIDSITIDNIDLFYSNYHVWDIDTTYTIINPVKLYHNARIFSRLLKFNELGEQINSITFYNYQIKEVLRYNNKVLIGLNSGKNGNRYSKTNYTCRFVLLDKNFNILWIKEQKKIGMQSHILTGFVQKENFAFNIEVIDICGGCYDHWWKYLLEINENGIMSYSFIRLPSKVKNTETLESWYSIELIDVNIDKKNSSFCIKN